MHPAKKVKRPAPASVVSHNRKPADDPSEPRETTFAHFLGAPVEFCNNADVEFHADTKILPAHSQILASRSHFLAKMFQDLKISFSRSSKFVVPEETLAGFTSAHLEQFLVRVYRADPPPIRSPMEAYELYRLADLFDSPTVRAAGSSYLVANAGSFLQATPAEPGVLKWFLIAEKYGMAELSKACLVFTAKHYGRLLPDARLQLLPSSTLIKLTSLIYLRIPSSQREVSANQVSEPQVRSDDSASESEQEDDDDDNDDDDDDDTSDEE